MSTRSEIKIEMEALDAEFERHGSTMPMNLWQQRRGELFAKLEDAERAARIEALRNPPQPKAATSRPKAVYRMSDGDRAELEEYNRKSEDAVEAGDIDALIGMTRDRRFRELMFESARERESEHSTGVNILALWFQDEQWGILNLIRVAQMRKANRRLDELAAEVEALKAKPQLSYCGVWSDSERYERGSLVTFDGSMWWAKEDTFNQPPSYNHDGSSPWILCVKKGRDGKSAR